MTVVHDGTRYSDCQRDRVDVNPSKPFLLGPSSRPPLLDLESPTPEPELMDRLS